MLKGLQTIIKMEIRYVSIIIGKNELDYAHNFKYKKKGCLSN